MDDELGTVTLDDGSGSFLTEHMDEVSATLEGGDGSKVRSPGVENTASEHSDPPALALPHAVGQHRHDGLDLLQHLGLLGTDG